LIFYTHALHQLNLIVLVYSHDNIIPVGKAENKVVLIISLVAIKTIRKSGVSASQRNNQCVTLTESVSHFLS